ncbi:hypothetical protein [Klebsiella quasipneumoniae]|uniref:hypothetical protein n=1 Tax=Klebsiella quasipneumoniae TaxID=1463165 RepID=UPI0005B61716|nr:MULTISPECIES: hypothetical protein [Klebsiella]QNC78762.1 hypothetical protein F3137_09300 [Klebsiella quasipneumoniae]QOV59896.1 hypothetical protein AMN10_06980 [Klebsiella variicola]CEP28729.1 exported hypothetical protein [Klebsiella variicola]
MLYGIEIIPALLLALLMIVTGSLAKFVYSKESKVTLRDHVVVSLFAGMVMFFFGLANGWSQPFIILGSGIGGWSGASIIRRIQLPGVGSDDNGDNDETN